MKIADKLLNHYEELVLGELSAIASENSLRTFSKVRVADVLQTATTRLSNRDFGFFTRSHFDFVVTEQDSKPFMAVEFDGPSHADPRQQERDAIKNALCSSAEFPLIRINANHVTRKFRGMTLLRWIVEVSQLQKAFNDGQAEGSVPRDEDFDPASFFSIGEERRFPYWLSAEATIRIHNFLKTQDQPNGWTGFFGHDTQGNIHRLEYIRIGERVVFAKTAVRHQNAPFPLHDLANEIGICELDEKLSLFKGGKVEAAKLNEFKLVHDRFHEKYHIGSSHSMGAGLEAKYKLDEGGLVRIQPCPTTSSSSAPPSPIRPNARRSTPGTPTNTCPTP
jgi:hypothetical protein